MQASKPSEHFGGLKGCAGHGEEGRGSTVQRSLPQTVAVEANKVCVFRVLGMCSKVMKLDVMLRDEIV